MSGNKECIFCRIIKGEIPSVSVYEDERCLAILDKFPATKGQSLVISKEHIPYIFEAEEELYMHLFKVARKIASAIDSAFKPLKTCIVVEGFEVPHVHIRLHPSYEARLETKGSIKDDSALREAAEEIKKKIR